MGDVDGPVAPHVTRDLHVANEAILSAHHGCAAPSETVISGAGNEDVRVGKIKVVPGNVHVSEEGRGWIVVGPSRFAVVAAGGVNAEMGPAGRVRGRGGLVTAKRAAARVAVDPDREPGAGWFVVEKNGVAEGIGKGATTAAVGEAGEGGAAVGGERCGGEVVAGCAS